jgi:hypothetical protein
MEPNWGIIRCCNLLWTWTTNQKRHLTKIERDRFRWLVLQANFPKLWFSKKKKKKKKIWGSETEKLCQKLEIML